jgi:drug/metabolite transporter (DMT)-like permease
MGWKQSVRHPGVLAALGAAILFGVGTPLAKLLLNAVNPWLLAGLLYFGSGCGLMLYRLVSGAAPVQLKRQEYWWLAGAVLSGGVIGPLLLMLGLSHMPASGVSLLLNAEGVFTTLLAWFVFKEHVDRRIATGMLLIIAGTVILSWPHQAQYQGLWPALSVLGACLSWGIDNNLTRKVSFTDATWIASVKGLVAGSVNLLLAILLGAALPSISIVFSAMLVGFFAYGVSLTLFILALRHLGTARTGAYFSVAPFLGAWVAVMMGAPVTIPLLVAGVLMAAGVWLHLMEHHVHEHTHEPIEHEHEHTHDAHHQHTHGDDVSPQTSHRHLHRHEALVHTHSHYPDIHHMHD